MIFWQYCSAQPSVIGLSQGCIRIKARNGNGLLENLIIFTSSYVFICVTEAHTIKYIQFACDLMLQIILIFFQLVLNCSNNISNLSMLPICAAFCTIDCHHSKFEDIPINFSLNIWDKLHDVDHLRLNCFADPTNGSS